MFSLESVLPPLRSAVPRPAAPLSHLREANRAVVGSVASDSHTWNLVFLQLLLEEHGYVVTNLGPCTPIELVVETCLDLPPDLLLISSVNGHGHVEGRELIEEIRSHVALSSMPAVIGGKLGILGPENARFKRPLLEAGYDAVFSERDGAAALPRFLAQEACQALAA
jgi:methylmalonyl-CoA mutase cobalamin-binding subunit